MKRVVPNGLGLRGCRNALRCLLDMNSANYPTASSTDNRNEFCTSGSTFIRGTTNECTVCNGTDFETCRDFNFNGNLPRLPPPAQVPTDKKFFPQTDFPLHDTALQWPRHTSNQESGDEDNDCLSKQLSRVALLHLCWAAAIHIENGRSGRRKWLKLSLLPLPDRSAKRRHNFESSLIATVFN